LPWPGCGWDTNWQSEFKRLFSSPLFTVFYVSVGLCCVPEPCEALFFKQAIQAFQPRLLNFALHEHVLSIHARRACRLIESTQARV